jgi:argininosuccinate lyase
MPQKKNPDAAELLRAKAPRVAGRLATLHGVLHGLPLTYNKDLQEDKEQLFDAVDTLELCLQVAAEMLADVTFDRERLAAAAADELLAATDVADLLVKRGVPFRKAHGAVAALVRTAVERGKAMSELGEDELEALELPLRGEDPDRPYAEFYELLAEGAWLESKVSDGGTALPRVRDQLGQARHILEDTAPAE